MKIWAALAVVVLLAGTVVCGGSDDADDEAASAYLDSVQEASLMFAANLEEFQTLFGQVWPLPSTMFDALQRAGAGSALDETVAAIDALEPPPQFEADHATLVAGIREMASVDRDVGKAVADKELIAFALANIALGQASIRLALSLSGPVCEAMYMGENDGASRWCKRLDESEGGDYGRELYGLMSTLETDVRPLAEAFVPQFASEEQSPDSPPDMVGSCLVCFQGVSGCRPGVTHDMIGHRTGSRAPSLRVSAAVRCQLWLFSVRRRHGPAWQLGRVAYKPMLQAGSLCSIRLGSQRQYPLPRPEQQLV